MKPKGLTIAETVRRQYYYKTDEEILEEVKAISRGEMFVDHLFRMKGLKPQALKVAKAWGDNGGDLLKAIGKVHKIKDKTNIRTQAVKYRKDPLFRAECLQVAKQTQLVPKAFQVMQDAFEANVIFQGQEMEGVPDHRVRISAATSAIRELGKMAESHETYLKNQGVSGDEVMDVSTAVDIFQNSPEFIQFVQENGRLPTRAEEDRLLDAISVGEDEEGGTPQGG